MEENLRNLSHLDIQDTPMKAHYILINETIMKRLKGSCNENIHKVSPGYLATSYGFESKDQIIVRLCTDDNKKLHDILWKCNPNDLRLISPLIWKLLSSVSSLQERVQIANNEKFCKYIENIKQGSKVWYKPNDSDKCLANVKFIGAVPKLGTGYYFGLDLSNKQASAFMHSLETQSYIINSSSPEVYTTISNVRPYTTRNLEPIRNFEQNFLSSNILQPKNTDNFFITKNKENNVDKKCIYILNKEKSSLFDDTDNNNQKIDDIAFSSSNYSAKNISAESQDYKKKLDRNLRSFDPLNSDYETDEVQPKNVQQYPNHADFKIGSHVKVLIKNNTYYGVIRWIGLPKGSNKSIAAIELDYEHPSATDGTYQNVRYIQCSPQKAYFTDLNNCQNYVTASSSSCYSASENQDFDFTPSSVANEIVPPIRVKDNLENICKKYRGIQGHHNSCYLDATLFSMFAFTSVFDYLLFRPPNEKDCSEYEEVQKVLREEIVNPLRKKLYVTAHHVMKLRTLLEKSSSISGFTSEEKDPEEFLTSLLAQTLKAKPFLKLSSGQDAYHYQLFVEKDDKLVFPSVQHLLEQSFSTSNIKLKEVPSCLIIQMPRFGKSYKMYSKIQPTLLLDVTDIIEDSPRECIVCGELANYECKDCYGQLDRGLQSTAFCSICVKRVHCHERRTNHAPNSLSLSIDYEMLKEHYPVRRLYLELLAVVCIETSHYVSFVKCAPGSDAPWCFFDSMADRKGEQNGHNIPEMVPCPDFSYWLSKEGANKIAASPDDRLLPKYAKRLLCDSYMCMYQSLT